MEVLYSKYGLCNKCITFLTSRLGKYICMGILTVIIFLLYEILHDMPLMKNHPFILFQEWRGKVSCLCLSIMFLYLRNYLKIQ